MFDVPFAVCQAADSAVQLRPVRDIDDPTVLPLRISMEQHGWSRGSAPLVLRLLPGAPPLSPAPRLAAQRARLAVG